MNYGKAMNSFYLKKKDSLPDDLFNGPIIMQNKSSRHL